MLQINKNWMVKARVGSDSAAAAVGLRLWHAVSAYATACVHLDYATRTPRWVVSGGGLTPSCRFNSSTHCAGRPAGGLLLLLLLGFPAGQHCRSAIAASWDSTQGSWRYWRGRGGGGGGGALMLSGLVEARRVDWVACIVVITRVHLGYRARALWCIQAGWPST